MLHIGKFKLTPLNGGITHMDGGAMFGVVPKPLWQDKYPNNAQNQVPLVTHPILIQSQYGNMLIDSGVGNGKLDEKQRRNYGVTYDSDVTAALNQLGLTPSHIDIVLMSHLHFDHALGLTTADGQSVFNNARIITSRTEWHEMRHPNVRSRATYWEMNYRGIEHQVEPFDDKIEICPGITMIHTGGHSEGHSIIEIKDDGMRAVHMADLLPTTAHRNPLWVTAYDDYPLDSIFQKEELFEKFDDAWFIFYHDVRYFAAKFDGREIIDEVRRKPAHV
ncbi:MBL fold metallo-hydrolase [Macrococcus equipercicus]|uniref:MBL fold metallo-hydrolase n=1 Tax=Macrococcus equipercicus TaxID=69967 RepID=A0ABQ6R7F4_9STAP|nr:MBL fold metallo-hydrolase [Macrococcus equipercicus]KAA1038400.1 MBL fold metallo-hydrolase [Macrococcus equipercicus]